MTVCRQSLLVSRNVLTCQANDIFYSRYVTGYIEFWNDENDQCNDVSWAPSYKAAAPLTKTLRKDMNSLVNK